MEQFDSSLAEVILINFPKALDIIDHNILIQKLPSLGFANEII